MFVNASQRVLRLLHEQSVVGSGETHDVNRTTSEAPVDVEVGSWTECILDCTHRFLHFRDEEGNTDCAQRILARKLVRHDRINETHESLKLPEISDVLENRTCGSPRDAVDFFPRAHFSQVIPQRTRAFILLQSSLSLVKRRHKQRKNRLNNDGNRLLQYLHARKHEHQRKKKKHGMWH